jgi:hypothetical protein
MTPEFEGEYYTNGDAVHMGSGKGFIVGMTSSERTEDVQRRKYIRNRTSYSR